VILNHKPLKGALFGSAFLPEDEFDLLFRIGGHRFALFYGNRIILLSPHLRALWPEAAPGMTLDEFLMLTEKIVPPAEKFHFGVFREKMKGEAGEGADIFPIRTVGAPSILGLAFSVFSWGRFLIAVPGERASPVREILDRFGRERLSVLCQALDQWVEDSETELLLTPLLESFPEEFREIAEFRRTVNFPATDGKHKRYEISYRYRGKKWQRGVEKGRMAEASGPQDSGKRSGKPGAGKPSESRELREKGVRVGNEIMIHFTVFLGGVFPLGEVSLPCRVLANEGIVRLNRFIRKISVDLVSTARSLSSRRYHFCRFWDENGFSFEGIEEIARIVDPGGWRNLVVLAFWGTDPDALVEVRTHCRVSDPFFVDAGKNMGLLLLRNCSLERARNTVAENLGRRVRAKIDPPATVGEFLSHA